MKKYLKFNWGTGIFISIVLFMTISVILAVIFMNQRVDLVTNNYYEKTLTYQNQIDTYKRTAELKEKVSFNYAGNLINLSFPGSFLQQVKNGKLYFYRPSDSRKDFTIPIRLNKVGSQSVNTTKIEKGYWKVEIQWTMNNEDYKIEKSVLIY
ncbi:MAG: FixH family protein [Ignavibacteriaceae bacterium]